MEKKDSLKRMIQETFVEIADAIESGEFGKRIKIGLTTMGSELGEKNLIDGAKMAKRMKLPMDVVLIGDTEEEGFESHLVSSEKEAHEKMESLLDGNEIDACVTMHYNFPIGVSTIGRVVTPARGKELIIATTTGTSSSNRIPAMIKNAVYGNIVAKSLGIENPKIGIMNLDGARQVEKGLMKLKEGGYELEFANSERSDGGVVMRGNDILTGAADVMVADSLTGNLIVKMMSSFTSGGSYESLGYGYGPGVGKDYSRNVFILSRASGSPVVANAIRFAFDCISGSLDEVRKRELKLADDCGLEKVLDSFLKRDSKTIEEKEVEAPPKKVVTSSISGIDIMDLEDAVKVLWENGIYAESGMGCTGPILLVSPEDLSLVSGVLKKSGYAFNEGDVC